MHNDFDSAAWTDHHQQLSDAIGRAIDKLGYWIKRVAQGGRTHGGRHVAKVRRSLESRAWRVATYP